MLHIPLVNRACIRSNKLKYFMSNECLSSHSLYNELVNCFYNKSLFTSANLVRRQLLIALYYILAFQLYAEHPRLELDHSPTSRVATRILMKNPNQVATRGWGGVRPLVGGGGANATKGVPTRGWAGGNRVGKVQKMVI